MNGDDFQVDFFGAQLTPESAQVMVRVSGVDVDAATVVAGQVRGPEILGRRTLPTTISLVNVPADPSRPEQGIACCAKASIVDPCYWSPEHPAQYQATVEIRRDNRVITSLQRQFGLRLLATRGKNFIWEGKRRVLRGAVVDHPTEGHLESVRDQSLALVAKRPSEDVCRWASREGLLIVAAVDASTAEVARELQRLAQWPAVGIIIIENEPLPGLDRRAISPNLLLAQRIDCEKPSTIAPWAQIVACDAADLVRFPKQASEIQLPVVALRNDDEPIRLDHARFGCDRLQRELAHIGDFAGYIVDLSSKL